MSNPSNRPQRATARRMLFIALLLISLLIFSALYFLYSSPQQSNFTSISTTAEGVPTSEKTTSTYTYTPSETSATQHTASSTSNTAVSKLVYIKRGGVRGVFNILEIEAPNKVRYTCVFSPRSGNMTTVINATPHEVSTILEQLINSLHIYRYNGSEYKAAKIYDYFSYEISLIMVNGDKIRVKWVDEWASSEPIPEDLSWAKRMLDDFIRQKASPCE